MAHHIRQTRRDAAKLFWLVCPNINQLLAKSGILCFIQVLEAWASVAVSVHHSEFMTGEYSTALGWRLQCICVFRVFVFVIRIFAFHPPQDNLLSAHTFQRPSYHICVCTYICACVFCRYTCTCGRRDQSGMSFFRMASPLLRSLRQTFSLACLGRWDRPSHWLGDWWFD